MAAGDSCVVHHRGRRYRRSAQQRRPEDVEKKEERSQCSPCSVISGRLPKPPPISESLSSELVRLPPATGDPQPFQRYKPLPPIGSTHPQKPQPSVFVCVRLPDGTRTSTSLPTFSPLSSLVASALNSTPARGWTLATSEVPKRELKDLSLTLLEAGITQSCTLHLVPPDEDST